MSRESIEAIGHAEITAAAPIRSRHTLPGLRVAGAVGTLLVVAYLAVTGIMPMLLAEMLILPINCLWLYRILRTAQSGSKT